MINGQTADGMALRTGNKATLRSSPRALMRDWLGDEGDVDWQTLRVMRTRIRDRMQWARTNIPGMEDLNDTSLSQLIGRNKSYIYHLLNNSKELPPPRSVERIAQVLACNPQWLYNKTGVPDIAASSPGVFVIGAVDAKHFHVMNAPYPRRRPTEVRVEHLPDKAQLFALDICDDVMNNCRAQDGGWEPILERMQAICVDLSTIAYTVKTGDLCAVRYTVKANGVILEQETIRRAAVFEDRIVLAPESTNDMHKPLTLRFDDEEPAVKILGLVEWYGFPRKS